MNPFTWLRETKSWLWLAAVVALMVLAVFVLGRCDRDRSREQDRAIATGKALDKVAKETPAIRQDQQERQREVDQIEGSDQRLPDGYGAELERLRDRERDPR